MQRATISSVLGLARPRSFQWSVTILGWPRPIAAGRTTDLAEARLLAETALGVYVCRRAADQATPSGQ